MYAKKCGPIDVLGGFGLSAVPVREQNMDLIQQGLNTFCSQHQLTCKHCPVTSGQCHLR